MNAPAYASVLAVAMMLAMPMANAGTPDDPEVEDASLDAGAANAWGDVTRAWLELSEDGETLSVWMEFHVLPETMPGVGLVYAFRAGNTTWYGAAATAPTLGYWWGRWDDQGPADQSEADGAWTSGPGGRVRVDVPVAQLPPDALVADAHHVMAWDIRPQLARQNPLLMDEATGERPLVLRAGADDALATAAESAAWDAAQEQARMPWASLALLLTAVGVGAAGWRRERR